MMFEEPIATSKINNTLTNNFYHRQICNLWSWFLKFAHEPVGQWLSTINLGWIHIILDLVTKGS